MELITTIKNKYHQFRDFLKQNILSNNNSLIRKGENTNFIFIHINKTAGTSIGTAIKLPRKSHLTAKEIIKLIGEKSYHKSFKFAVVRNPWSKVVSHYKYRIKTNQTGMKDTNISFKDWVKATYGETKNSVYYDKPKMFYPQVEWLKDNSNQVSVDQIIKFENLAEEFELVRKKIGIATSLPHKNKTNKDNYRDYYDSETKKIIQAWFQEDIKLFNYSF
jgi:chondroitin 4-sulfotransferase 11